MPVYQRKDRYYQKAKDEGFRSRAAYKLRELDKNFRLFKKVSLVVDLGCAPGSWAQVAAEHIKPLGLVVGIDLEAIPPLGPNVVFIQGDIREEATKQRLLAELGRKVDVVLSDMSPHLSGIKFQDHYNSYELAEQAFQTCREILREGGDFVVKIFPGEELETFKKHVKDYFQQVKTFIPDATRKTSTEVYIVGKGFRKN